MSKIKHFVFSFIPVVLLWAIIILPSCRRAVWSSLDDGAALVMARYGLAASFNTNGGRIFPVYHLHNWLLYQLGGINPTFWYAAQSLEFLLLALFTYLAVSYISANRTAGALASAVLLTSAPIAENAYTVAKCEARVALFFSLMFLMVSHIFVQTLFPRKGASGFVKGLSWLGLLVAATLAVYSKESAISIGAAGIAGMLFSYLHLKGDSKDAALKVFLLISLATLSLALSLVLIRAHAVKALHYVYTAFSFDLDSSLRNVDYYVQQSPDILVILAACFLFGIVRLWIARRSRIEDDRSSAAAVMAWTSLAVALAYLALLCVWREHCNYYMLPIAVCASLSLGYFWGSRMPAQSSSPRLLRWAAGILLILVGATRFYSLPYLHFIATAQRGFDVIEDSVAKQVFNSTAVQPRIIDLERPYFVEQPYQRNLLFDVFGTSHFEWVGGRDLLQESPENLKKAFGATAPSPLAQSPPKPGDLLLIPSGNYPFPLDLRGIGPGMRSFKSGDETASMFKDRTGLDLSEYRTWDSAWPVFQPWFLKRDTLEFRSVLYKCILGAIITSPQPGSVFTSSTVTFIWLARPDASQYSFSLGLTHGGSEICNHNVGTALSVTIPGIPTDGRLIYARLGFLIAGKWIYHDCAYTASYNGPMAVMVSPKPGSELSSSAATFKWSAGKAVQYHIYVGTTLGGEQIYSLNQGPSLSATIPKIPANGVTIYVRLWSLIDGKWIYIDYLYMAPGGLGSKVRTAESRIDTKERRSIDPPRKNVGAGEG
jgi:hypothetical protein